MAKLSKEELIAKVNESGLSDDEKISFMEDITDSFESSDTTELDNLKNEYETLKGEYEDLKTKYKDRFLSKEVVEEKKEETGEMEEKEYVDVKDIFGKKEDEE